LILDIIKYPHISLKTNSKTVDDFDEELNTLLDDMYDTMIDGEGIGLASIQVGIAKRVLIINLPNDIEDLNKDNLIEAINPIILETSNPSFNTEGCLSVPKFNAKVKRFQNITVKFQDRNGKFITANYQDYEAVAWQHEIDHLNGVLFVEKLSIIDKKKFLKAFQQKK